MGGKASLIIIMGFSLALLFFGQNNNNISNTATRNYVNHLTQEVAHNIAVSGANLAANRFFVSPAWEPSNEGLDDASLMGGSVAIQKSDEPGKPGRVRIVSTGTYMGASRRVTVVMQATSFGKFVLFINSMGTGGYFPQNTYFDGPIHINVPYKNGVPDPAQTFRVDGGTYKGKVTSDLMWTAVGNKKTPDFQQGFQDGVHVTLPDEFDEKIVNAVDVGTYDEHGNHQVGFEFTKDRNVSVVMNNDGTMTYKLWALTDTMFNKSATRCSPPADAATAAAQGWVTKSLNSLVPAGKVFNGAILIRNGNLRLKGTLDGRVTFGVLNEKVVSGTLKKNVKAPAISQSTFAYYASGNDPQYFSIDPTKERGNVWFEDDVFYKDNPYDDTPEGTQSDDMLGIVATNYIFAADNSANNAGLVTHGSYFSKYYGATTENLYRLPDMRNDYSTGSRTLVDWEYRGGWTEGQAMYTTLSSGKGYDQIYKYDPRLASDSPPFFPATGALSILSWLEE